MNNETKHTPEPWHVLKYAHVLNEPTRGRIHGANSDPVVDDANPTHANARRIVACVNACAAISDNELTHGPVIALNKFSFVVNEREEAREARAHVARERDTAIEQRDELAAALRMALRVIPEGATFLGADPTDPDAEIEVHYELSALLAKVQS